MSIVSHIKSELKMAGYTPLEEKQEDGPNKWIQENLIELGEVFAKQRHSGFSANYCISAMEKLLRFKPLTPLTGKPEEWMDVGHGTLQNKRLSSVFKNGETAYDINAYLFEETIDGSPVYFGCYLSREKVNFPYTQGERIVVKKGSLRHGWLWLKYKLGVNKEMWR